MNVMKLIEQLVARAKADKQRIVLPEGTEERTLKAANQLLTDGVADLILIGNPEEIAEKYRAVTKERIIEAAKSLVLDTVYVMSPKEDK
jgi:phosphate acetyltransferase